MAKKTFSIRFISAGISLCRRQRPGKLFGAHSLMVCMALAVIIGAVSVSAAEPYPTHPIRLIVPYSPGGNADIQGRYMAKRLSDELGQQVIVDNRPGGNSIIGTKLAAKAPADGYTILQCSSGFALNVSMSRLGTVNLPYDPLKDFIPISSVSETPLLFAINPKLPVNNVKEFIAFAKSRPGELNFSSSGNGSTSDRAGKLLNKMTGINTVHVPYKSLSQAKTAVMAGYVQFVFPSVTSTMPQVKAGMLKAIAIASLERSPLAPELPTISESGVPGFRATEWTGLLVPSGTPQAIVTRLNQAIVKILKSTEARNYYSKIGADILDYNSPKDFKGFIESEANKWTEVFRETGIQIRLQR